MRSPHVSEDNVHRVGVTLDGKLNLRHALRLLAEDGMTRLLVEGGPMTARAFLDAGLVDEAVIFRGATPVTGAGLLPLVDRGVGEFEVEAHWRVMDRRAVGPDAVTTYRSRRHD